MSSDRLEAAICFLFAAPWLGKTARGSRRAGRHGERMRLGLCLDETASGCQNPLSSGLHGSPFFLATLQLLLGPWLCWKLWCGLAAFLLLLPCALSEGSVESRKWCPNLPRGRQVSSSVSGKVVARVGEFFSPLS